MKFDYLKLFSYLIVIFFGNTYFSQHAQWGLHINGSPDQKGLLMVADQNHNLYVAGNFEGTVDFDPGQGNSSLTASGTSDVFIMKLSAEGDFLWVKQIGGIDYEKANDLLLDQDGNLLIIGYFFQNVDFDTGTTVSELTSVGANDIFILKLNQDGNFIWVKQYGSTSSDFGNSIALNSMNEIVITGQFDGTMSFQNETITSNGGSDMFIIKFDSLGQYIWGQNIGGMFWDAGFFVEVDRNDDIYVSGVFGDLVDFNPSISDNFLSAQGMLNTFVLKLDSNGNFQFANNIGSDGTEFPTSINFDSQNNLYLTGYFDFIMDIDPSPNSVNLNPIGGNDFYISKFDSIGNFLWAKSLGSPGEDYVFSSIFNSYDTLYMLGTFQQTLEIDLSSGISQLVSSGQSDIFLLTCDTNGNFYESGKIGADFNDEGYNIIVDEMNNLYLSGLFTDTVDFDWEIGELPLISNDTNDIFIVKLSQKPSPPIEIIGTSTICENTLSTFSSQLISGADSYHWMTSSGIEIISGQGTDSIQVTAQNQNGTIGFFVENSFGASDTVYLSILVNPLPELIINANPADTVLSGSSVILTASGADSIQWTNNIQNGVPFFPIQTENYTVIGISGICLSTDSITIVVNTLGINQIEKNKNLPILHISNNQLFVSNCTFDTYYQIYDLSGKQLLANENYHSDTSIDITSLATGHYVIHLNGFFLRFSVLK